MHDDLLDRALLFNACGGGRVTPGHCLVIPKKHFESMIDAELSILQEIIKASKQVGKMLMDKYDSTGYNILNANGKSAQQTVFHLHFHIIPRREADELDMWIGKGDSRKEIHK